MGLANSLTRFLIFGALLLGPFADAAMIVDSLPGDLEVDYVVVGGGTGGLVTANRLSASGATVVVIEAGPNGQFEPLINDPFQYVTLFESGQYNWNWPTVNQTVGGKKQVIAGGKVLGGSSSINGMDWTRGSVDQYNTIAYLNYDESWAWKNFLKFLKKAEHFVPPSKLVQSHGATFEADVHGYKGPIKTGYPNPWNGWGFGKLFVKAAHKIWGLHRGGDVCSGNPNVATQNALSIGVEKNGTSIRSSAARGYLYPFLGKHERKGLVILPGHQATRILWAKGYAGGKAIARGVEYTAVLGVNRKAHSVKVRKEVIVSAGSIQSPAFLQLSGVGEKKHLESVGIKQVVDLPSVGTNLQDQALLLYLFAAAPPYSTDPAFASPIQNLAGTVMAFPNIDQLFGKDRAAQLIAKLRATREARAKAVVKSGGYVSVSGLSRVYKSQINLIERGTPIGETECGNTGGFYNCVSWPLLPQNRGTVKIASSNPFDYPTIDPRYLDADFDVAVSVALARSTREALALPEVSKVFAAEVLPPPTFPVNASDAEYAYYISSAYAPVYHPVGSVPMLPKKDGGAVDSRLRLYGTKNVRTIDASVIPVQLSAHLSSTVYGIAEKGAAMILEDNH